MNDERQAEEYQVPVQVHQTWWAPILGALLLLALAWYEFRELEQLETGTREWVRIHIFQKLLYELGGKWAAIALLVFPALLLLRVGTRRLLTDRRRFS